MFSHHRSQLAGTTLSLLVVGAIATVGSIGALGCAGNQSQAKQPQTPAATELQGGASTGAEAAGQPNSPKNGAAAGHSAASGSSDQGEEDDDDAELVVSRDIVGRCPKLRLVRQHVAEFDPDMVWLAVLESLGECMGQGGPMADQNVGVSGDEEHRHVVREVLGTRGVAPTRVIATPTSAAGAAECQGGAGCSKRVEITIAPSP
jgi:hypothetical protein